jgi:hypothetical protein
MLRKLAPALIAPLLVATACATEADDAAVEVRTGPAAAVALRSAPEAAAEAGTAAFEMVMEMAVAGERFEIVATGAYDAVNERMSLEMDMGAMFEELAAASGETIPDGLEEPMQMVVDGTTIYMRAPMFAVLGGPTGWLSMTPEDLGTTSDALGVGAGAYDPSAILETLRGVSGEPEVVGTEVVRGVETTHYVANMDLAAALASAPEDQRELLEAQLEQLGQGTIPVDVWVDADGLPRRMAMDMGGLLSSMGSDGEASAVMTMEFFDYGEPVDIQVPSPDEVSSFSDLLGGLDVFSDDAS